MMGEMKNLSVVCLLVAVVIATVASFGGDATMGGGFGGDDFDRKYQNWLDKRGGMGQSQGSSFGAPLGTNGYRYFNWKNYLANGPAKRQLNYGPRSFGNFQRYFTNGLQDWRSTYTAIKKRAVSQQASAAASAAAAAEHEPATP